MFFYSIGFSQVIHDAAREGNLEQVRELIEKKGISPDLKKEDGSTPLHLAAMGGYVEVLSLLLDKGTEINVKNGRGMTPLFFAVYGNHIEAVKLLVSKGAEPSGIPSPLIFAAGQGEKEIVQILLDAGADINASGFFGTALNRAAFMGFEDIVRILVDRRANVHATMRNDWTPLFMSALNANPAICNKLLDNGADINAMDTDGRTPLHLTLQNGTGKADEVTALLILRGTRINTKSVNDETPTMEAVKKGYTEVVRLLLENGADTDAVGKETNRTLLHMAAIRGFGNITSLLLEYDLNPNAEDKDGFTPLYYAGKYVHKTVASQLFAHHGTIGKRINTKNKKPYIHKSPNEEEAAIWAMRDRGWFVKTKNHLCVFDNEDQGRRPDSPSLNYGMINAPEISDQNVFALYTCYHAEENTLEFIHGIEKSLDQVTYLHYKEDPWRGCDNSVYLKGDEIHNLDNVEIQTVEMHDQSGMGWLGYLIKADSLTIYYSGFHAGDLSSYQKEIDTIAENCERCDLAFLDYRTPPGEENEYMKYALTTLNPGTAFLMDAGRQQFIPAEVVDKVQKQFPAIRIEGYVNPGDRYFYGKGILEELNYLRFSI